MRSFSDASHPQTDPSATQLQPIAVSCIGNKNLLPQGERLTGPHSVSGSLVDAPPHGRKGSRLSFEQRSHAMSLVVRLEGLGAEHIQH